MDLETTGNVLDPASQITGLGLASEWGCVYVGLRGIAPAARDWLWDWIGRCSLVAHNVLFDSTWLRRETGRWLNWQWCTYGLYKQLATEGYPGQLWGLKRAQLDVLRWPETNEGPLREHMKLHAIPDERMGEVPDEILGPYCAADADSCWQLLGVLKPVVDNHPALRQHHQEDFLTEVRLLGEQWVRGMAVDERKLIRYASVLDCEIVDRRAAWLAMPTVAPHVQEFAEAGHRAYLAKTPRGKLGTDRFAFNLNSKPQLAWLFFDRLNYPIIQRTPTGRPVVDKKILPNLGDEGRQLAGYNKKIKELGYVEACRTNLRDGTLHPQFRAPGTLTGRLSGAGGFNIQQQPKTRGYLECLVARPGHRMVQLDFAALEPIVLAEASRDPALLQIYGPTAKPNDIYLFTAANIRGLGDRIRQYYDPENPTPEGIAAAKRHCKADRQVAKIVQLAKTYNAGPRKIHETLTLGGIKISLEEVQQICSDFDRLYAGVQHFKSTLEGEWRRNSGWIHGGLGRPLAVSADLTKDLVNRYCQTTGHDILMRYIWYVEQVRGETGVPMWPLIVDYHDETIWEAPEHRADEAAVVMKTALSRLNGELQPHIPLKGEVLQATNLAQIKVEE